MSPFAIAQKQNYEYLKLKGHNIMLMWSKVRVGPLAIGSLEVVLESGSNNHMDEVLEC